MCSLAQAMDFLNGHCQFKSHSAGAKYMLFGLNSIGCDSIILYDKKYWKFIHFDNLDHNKPVYVNKFGTVCKFDFDNPEIYKNTTRVELI